MPTAEVGTACTTEQGEPGKCVAGFVCKALVLGTAAFSWGFNGDGQLGNGSTVSSNVPVAVSSALVSAWTLVSAGQYHMCGITSDAKGYCWGRNSAGQLGTGSSEGSDVPVQIHSDVGANWTQLSAGYDHTCGIDSYGVGYCWGDNNYGQLGDGTAVNSIVPVTIKTDIPTQWKLLSSGGFHTCGVTSDGKGFCWGDGGSGQLGTGAFANSLTPVAISTALVSVWKDLSAGRDHTCGVAEDDKGFCWGSNRDGQLGDGGLNRDSSVPLQIDTDEADVFWRLISAGGLHTCGINLSNRGFCWGYGVAGQLGSGSLNDTDAPTPISTGSVAQWNMIDAGFVHTCGISTEGKGYCWGDNTFGELGDATNTLADVPVMIKAVSFWSFLTAGFYFTGGLLAA